MKIDPSKAPAPGSLPDEERPDGQREGLNAVEMYLGMARAELDVAYSNRAVVRDWQGYLQRWHQRGIAVYRERPCSRDLRYGPEPRQRIDLFPAGPERAPTVLFLHGGYWQWNDKEGQAFVADGLLPHGINVAIGEYTLAPQARMPQIAEEATSMVQWLAAELGRRRMEASRLWVCGISTGAHLMALTVGLPQVRGGLLISGIYDLEPIRLSSLNDPIGMTRSIAERYSPIRHIPPPGGVVTISHGGAELPEIVRQSRAYADALRACGWSADLLPVEGADHFSILETLAAPEGRLARHLADMVTDAIVP